MCRTKGIALSSSSVNLDFYVSDSTQVGINAFADLTTTEFREKYLLPSPYVDNHDGSKLNNRRSLNHIVANKHVDWREKGAVTKVHTAQGFSVFLSSIA